MRLSLLQEMFVHSREVLVLQRVEGMRPYPTFHSEERYQHETKSGKSSSSLAVSIQE
jgi:hypothetical protein